MRFEMVYPDAGNAEPVGHRFGEIDAHHERADEAGTGGNCNAVKGRAIEARFTEGLIHNGNNETLVRARGKLGNNSTPLSVDKLGGYNIGTYVAVIHYSGGCFVAG